MFGLPAGGRLLVEGGACRNQLFRAGSVDGVLFHLEIPAGEVGQWADEYADELESAGGSKAAVIAACEAADSTMAELSALLPANFLRSAARVPLAG